MTRAPIKLSREMKLLLLLLLMVALIGAWYVWTNNRNAAALAAPSTAGTTDTGTDTTGPEAIGPATADTGTTGTETTSTVTGTEVSTGDTAQASPGATPAATGQAETAESGTGKAGTKKAGTGKADTGKSDTDTTNADMANAGTSDASTGLAAGAGQETVPLALSGGASGQNDATQDGAAAGKAGALAVQSNRPVEIEIIPPFPTPEVPSAEDGAATPGGINPQASVASLPRNNPFRPLSLDRSSAQATSTPATSSGLAGSGSPFDSQATPQTSTPDNSVQTTPITPSSNAGPLAISPVPGAGGTTSVSSGSLSGLPSIPGADGSAGLGNTGLSNTGLGSPSAGLDISGSGVTSGSVIPGGTVSGSAPGRTISGSSGDSGVTVIGGSGATGSGTTGPSGSRSPGAAGNAGRTTGQTSLQGNVVITAPKPPKPIQPPVAGVNVPSVTRVPVTPSRPAASASTGSRPASGAAMGNSAGNAGTGRPIPGTPQVITSLGQGAGDEIGAATTASKLEQFVQKRQLVFNAAVLGPINTAIFRGQDGYVVVAVGQTLPDSQVTVREVNATTAVLSLGNDLKTLELDQR